MHLSQLLRILNLLPDHKKAPPQDKQGINHSSKTINSDKATNSDSANKYKEKAKPTTQCYKKQESKAKRSTSLSTTTTANKATNNSTNKATNKAFSKKSTAGTHGNAKNEQENPRRG